MDTCLLSNSIHSHKCSSSCRRHNKNARCQSFGRRESRGKSMFRFLRQESGSAPDAADHNFALCGRKHLCNGRFQRRLLLENAIKSALSWDGSTRLFLRKYEKMRRYNNRLLSSSKQRFPSFLSLHGRNCSRYMFCMTDG